MIDELAFAGPEHLDAAFVVGFDRKQGYPDPADDLDALAAQGLDASATVVDLGTGTGQFALAAARRFGHVTAVDVSPAMLALLRERAGDAGLDNLDCVRAGFLSYAHAGPPADAVYTRHALHQLPDFWKALALDRIARMLRPGGVCGCATWSTTSARTRPRRSSGTGSSTPPRIPPRGTPARTTPNTSAPSSAPSAGCSSRCWPRPASR
jgi:Methylase involved in ubiquinone/menaquinone biosynthesis